MTLRWKSFASLANEVLTGQRGVGGQPRIAMRYFGLLLAVALVAASCQVQPGDVVNQQAGVADAAPQEAAVGSERAPGDQVADEGGDEGGDGGGDDPESSSAGGAESRGGADVGGALPALGPLPAASHWHAAYVIRICNDVLDPLMSEDDPLGIHTHGDGLMHIHPFFEEAGYEHATIGLFADAVGLGLTDGELTLPTGGTWRDGDVCDGVPSQVYVDRWEGPFADSPVERIFTNLEDIRFTGDGELYQIAFAPPDSPPVVPPSEALLSEVSNFGPVPEPWIEVPAGTTLDQVSFWAVADITRGPCEDGLVPERTSASTSRCFVRDGQVLAAADGVISARAVAFNRRPAVEITMDGRLQVLIADHFSLSQDPFVFAVELDGAVSTIAQLFRPPVGDRLVIASGFDEVSARAMAELLDS